MSKPVRSAALAITLFVSTAALAGMQARVQAEDFHALRAPAKAGAKIRLHNVPLGDSTQTLELERFDVWAPGAELLVQHGDGSTSRIEPPAMNYFRGTVGGDPDTMVFVSARADGAVDGMVFTEEARYTIRSTSAKEVIVDEAGPQDIPPDGGFTCELDGAPATKNVGGIPKVRSDASLAADGTLSGTGTWTLHLAIETDYELYTDLGSSSSNVALFIGNLVGAASVIYQRDLRTELLVSFSRIQTSAADPFNVDPGTTGTWNGSSVTYSTSHALAELGDLWGNSGTRPFNGARSSVVLVSGKQQTAGVAWVGTTCGSDFSCGSGCGPVFNGHIGGRYAYVGLGNQFTTNVPAPNNTTNGIQYGVPSSNYWALLGFAHELGHNVDGPHTHCFGLSAADKTTYNVTRNFIDECFVQGGNCFTGTTSVPTERGTIMSYCHLAAGSWPTTRFLFGRSGEASELMANHIRSYINSVTPASPSITAPASIDVNTSGNASINSPSGTLTYQWSITNGTINGSSTGNTVNFTATAHPVTLRARATNASGCAASDFVNVSVNTCTPPTLTSYTRNVNITLGSTVELNATATGNAPITYQWYVGTSGNTSTPAATGNPINASPSSTTTYWVRATNSCGQWADSPTITITVTPPSTTNTSLYIVPPCRVIDTRSSSPLASAAIRDVTFIGACGIPAGAKAVVSNVVAVAPATTGFLSIYPAGGSWPGNSTLNYRAGKTRANNAIIVLSNDGRATVLNNGAAQHFIIDVTGYFQ